MKIIPLPASRIFGAHPAVLCMHIEETTGYAKKDAGYGPELLKGLAPRLPSGLSNIKATRLYPDSSYHSSLDCNGICRS